MVWTLLVALSAALAVTAWHMQRPRPRRVAISFARFVPELPSATQNRLRLSLSRPRDLLPLVFLLLALGLGAWALIDGDRNSRATLPQHLGLRLVVDRSHSMGVADGDATRSARALARVEEARALLLASGAPSRCLEFVGVGAVPGAVEPMPVTRGIQHALLAPLPEGAEPAALIAAALSPATDCALTHVLVVTDQPPQSFGGAEGPRVIWDQVGAPVANAGIRSLALQPGAMGQTLPVLHIDGVYSGQDLPASLRLEGPGGVQDLPVYPSADVEGRWYARAPYAGPGLHVAQLQGGGAYAGDDHVRTQIIAPVQLAVDWQLDGLARPAVFAPGGAGDLRVVAHNDTAAPLASAEEPILLGYSGFGAAADGRRIGPFREDPVLFGALNFDALEIALPSAFPGALPAGFAPVLTDDQGGVLVARRRDPPGILVPVPRPDLAEPARSLSLTLFFSALADLASLSPQPLDTQWLGGSGVEISEAWRESHLARPLAEPVALSALTVAGTAQQDQPVWPWFVLAAIVSVLGERLLRLIRSFGKQVVAQ